MSNRKVRVGVFGLTRGHVMVEVMSRHPDAEVVAVCDGDPMYVKYGTELALREGSTNVTGYDNFDKFFEHDMDAVVLANSATAHAPFAIRLLNSGRHVTSEVVACQTMAEAVALTEAVENSGKVYTFMENFCYFKGTFEMQRRYKMGDIGEFLHGEGEYIHDSEGIWPLIVHGRRNHWMNWVPSTFYCTHSVGPIMSITGTRPVRVTAYETPNVNKRCYGAFSGDGAVLLCQMSNGATAKFLPYSSFKRKPDLNWYAVYGTKGMMETERWGHTVNRVSVFVEGNKGPEVYDPAFPFETEASRKQLEDHEGADFYTMHFFLDAILDRPGKEFAVDVYQGLDMTFPGLLGFRSLTQGNAPIDIPDFRDPAAREPFRNDHWTVDPNMAGPGQPESSSSWGPVDIPDSTYERQIELEKTAKWDD